MRRSLGLKVTVLLSAVVAGWAGMAVTGPAAGARDTAGSSHLGLLPPRNPAASLSPAPSFLGSCSQGADGAACNNTALAAIRHARQTLEKLGGMSFSLAAYEKLTPAEQLFVTVNLERTARGLAPAVVLSRSLDTIAQAGAQADRDPALSRVPYQLPGGGRPAYLGGTWAGGWSNPLGSDYGWMYDDGPGSPNHDCRAASSAACWGHRDIILTGFTSRSCGGGQAELAAGAGHAVLAGGYGESDTEILAGVCGPVPADAAFTWAQAKKLLHIT
jgi:hypothetical protein